MIAAEFKTIEEYNKANQKAHNLLKDIDGYNSPMYAKKIPLESIKETYLLPLVERFKKHLPFDFKKIDTKYIKQESFDVEKK